MKTNIFEHGSTKGQLYSLHAVTCRIYCSPNTLFCQLRYYNN